jgi:hypothetical protein
MVIVFGPAYLCSMYAPLSCVLKAIQNVITSRLSNPKPEGLDQKKKEAKVNLKKNKGKRFSFLQVILLSNPR